MIERPKVSVSIITYNHEAHVGEAIESVLMQKVDFPYEIVIGVDASTDCTADIVRGYHALHPEVIRPLFHATRIGMIPNRAAALAACRGEYVALLDGDDYWVRENKLQRQVDMLDAHPETAISFHQIVCIENGEFVRTLPLLGREVFELDDLLCGQFIPTGATVFRRRCFHGFPEWHRGLEAVDWVLHVLIASGGNIRFIPEVMTVYGIHGANAWAGKGWARHLRITMDICRVLAGHLEPRHARIVRDTWFQQAVWMVEESLASGDRGAARRAALSCLWIRPFGRGREKAAAIMKSFFPRLFEWQHARRLRGQGVR